MPPRGRTIIHTCITLLAWVIAAATLVPAPAWLLSGTWWKADLAANLNAQVLILAIAMGAIVAALRRWRALIVVGVSCVLLAWPLVTHRAAYLPRAVALDAPPVQGVVRFLHYNDSSLSDKEDVYALMERSGADVLSILCPPVKMQFDVIYGHGLEDRYAGKILRPWRASPDGYATEITAAFMVSRWPIEPFDVSAAGPYSDRLIAGVVRRPEGALGVIAVHPRSPRTASRWQEGNRVIEATVAAALRMRAAGLPVVVLSDLNSTPSGWRSRALCSGAGLARAKPLLQATGTFPDVVRAGLSVYAPRAFAARWPASIAIDDAVVSDGIRVVGWSTLPRLKSEHLPIFIELQLPESAPWTSEANSGGR